MSRRGSLTRDKLIGYLWPERDTSTARHLLSVSLNVLRGALGSEALVTTGDQVSLDSRCVDVDTRRVEAALEARQTGAAIALYMGTLLDGFFLPEAPQFEQWVESARSRAEQLGASAAGSPDGPRAIGQ